MSLKSLIEFKPLQKFLSRDRDDVYEPSHWLSEEVMGADPSIDVVEKKKKYIVRAEVPGVDPKDIKIRYRDGVLTIEGEKKHEEERNEKERYYFESSYGRFVRSIPLEVEVDESKAEASCRNGVLKITLPKKEGAEKNGITIKVK